MINRTHLRDFALSPNQQTGDDHQAFGQSSAYAPSEVCATPYLDFCKGLAIGNMITGKRRIARDATLYRQHDRMLNLYLVRFGQLKSVSGQLSDERVVDFHMAGDLLGIDAIATGKYNFRVTALENAEVCEIPFARVADAIGKEPQLRNELLRIMSAALLNEYGQSSLLASPSLNARFAGFLLWLGEKYAIRGFSQRSFPLSMSRTDIGSYLGTRVETVSRLIARFNADEKVLIKGRQVEVLDRSFLKEMVFGR